MHTFDRRRLGAGDLECVCRGDDETDILHRESASPFEVVTRRILRSILKSVVGSGRRIHPHVPAFERPGRAPFEATPRRSRGDLRSRERRGFVEFAGRTRRNPCLPGNPFGSARGCGDPCESPRGACGRRCLCRCRRAWRMVLIGTDNRFQFLSSIYRGTGPFATPNENDFHFRLGKWPTRLLASKWARVHAKQPNLARSTHVQIEAQIVARSTPPGPRKPQAYSIGGCVLGVLEGLALSLVASVEGETASGFSAAGRRTKISSGSDVFGTTDR